MVQRYWLRPLLAAVLVVSPLGFGGGFGAGAAFAEEPSGDALLAARCASCHAPLPDGGLSRVSEMRKTPEGWDMTLVRMMVAHGVALSRDDRALLVKHLADRQGLAPEETQPFRYILERRPNVIEAIPEAGDLEALCARCHTYARVALQRRDADEWEKLAHFHMGQWPTIEYQALGRDRNWWEIASQQVPQTLGALFPLETPDWTAWANASRPDLSGTWRVVGHRPGQGAYAGAMTIEAEGADRYAVRYALTFADGTEVLGTGTSILYSGFEWRGSVLLGDEQIQEVYAVSDGGNALDGRWFLEDADEIGGDFRAVREREGHREILMVEPGALRIGSLGEVTVHGTGLDGTVSLGDGVRIVRVLARDDASVRVLAEASAGMSPPGARKVTVGTTEARDLFAVYAAIDHVRVEPEYGIARVGGGPVPPVAAQFVAVAYLNGADGEAGTADDVRLGVMPATWSVDNFNETAAAMKDTDFAGDMQPDGLFVPAVAGPNPERKFGTNNVGDLAVKATVTDGDRTVEGTGHLIVTVQRWVDPPIR